MGLLRASLVHASAADGRCAALPFSYSLLLSSLDLSDKKVHEPKIRALLGTAAHFCEVVVLKLRTAAGKAEGRNVGVRLHSTGPCRPEGLGAWPLSDPAVSPLSELLSDQGSYR